MNVISANSIIQGQPNTKVSSRSQVQSELATKLNLSSNNTSSELQNRQNESIRVIRVASDGVKVAEFGAKNQSINRSQSSLLRKPEEHYQNNQQLLEREEIGSLLGVDIFA
jgi:hypothetical protein